MPKYDAFGREIGEDTLAGLGGTSEAQPAAEPLPAESGWTQAETAPQPVARSVPAAPATITIPVRQPGPRKRRRGRRVLGFVVLALVALFVLPLLIAGFAIVNTVEDATRGLEELLKPERQAPAQTGLGVPSLVRAANFGPAMRRLRAERYGGLTSLRVAPDRIDAQFRTDDGRLTNVQLRADGELQEFGRSGPGFGAVDTSPFSRVRRRTPELLTRRAAERVKQPASQLDYLALSGVGPRDVLWGVFFKDGAHVQGFADGRVWRRVG